MEKRVSILIVEDDLTYAERLKKNLEMEGYHVNIAEGGEEGLSFLREEFYDLSIVDIKMPDLDGMSLLKKIKEGEKGIDPEMPVVMLTSVNDVHTAVEAMRAGAADYITKESDRPEIIIRLKKVLQQHRLLNENRYLRMELERSSEFGEIVGVSDAIKKIKELVAEVTHLDVPVLITGETGVGKELVARAVHRLGPRCNAPFIDINCAALPGDTMFQSELFGHEKGAFTGAESLRRGKFELAVGGTLFFDEVSELSPESQAKLLRVIETLEFTRLGGTRPIKANCRLIFATNQNLDELVKDGKFRRDLYYRMSVFPIHIPPLRERPEDIEVLVAFFLSQFSKKYNRPLKGLSPEALQELRRYPWPGNVRELRNVMERLVIKVKDEEITISNLRECGLGRFEGSQPLIHIPEGGLNIDELERELVIEALRKANWNQREAARLLGISPDRMYNRIKKYGITHPSWRVHK